MKYAGLKKNDIANGDGICVSFWTQGCPFHCEGCHNPETWDFNGGEEFTDEVMNEILAAIPENGVHRSFSILGGEPLCHTNIPLVYEVIKNVKHYFPSIKIYLWSGFHFEDLLKNSQKDTMLESILNQIDILIDGPFILSHKNLGLYLRGSDNQRVIDMKETLARGEIILVKEK